LPIELRSNIPLFNFSIKSAEPDWAGDHDDGKTIANQLWMKIKGLLGCELADCVWFV
jgi:hypothetical protein